jgi:hypothetical protein
MSVELKIKSKHLSEEARIIRFEERKFRKQVDWLKTHQQTYDKEHATMMSLKQHRRWDVRNENRATFLARTYLAGKDYKTVEHKCNDLAVLRCWIFPRLCEMVNKYGPPADKLSKKWNRERMRYEYDPEPWKEHEKKVLGWLGL